MLFNVVKLLSFLRLLKVLCVVIDDNFPLQMLIHPHFTFC